MRIAVLGGKLQGMEACYLANKAGYHALLIDRTETPPARGLCAEFLHGDICAPDKALLDALAGADAVLPAFENITSLDALERLTKEYGLNTAFDFDAYRITRSKQLSDALFWENGIPAPEPYPDCQPPYIFKPSCASGSAGVRCFSTRAELEAHIAAQGENAQFVAQHYIEGPSYSIEVTGRPGAYRAYQVTEIHVDESRDCNRVTCPCGAAARPGALKDIALRLASLINLHGIMDVESILDENGVHRILEMDARLPSQTPTAVYHSTGINLLSELVALFVPGTQRARPFASERFVSLEHIVREEGGVISRPGEHIMAARPPVTLRYNEPGADELITDGWQDGRLTGTFINAADTQEALEEKRRTGERAGSPQRFARGNVFARGFMNKP